MNTDAAAWEIIQAYIKAVQETVRQNPEPWRMRALLESLVRELLCRLDAADAFPVGVTINDIDTRVTTSLERDGTHIRLEWLPKNEETRRWMERFNFDIAEPGYPCK